MEFEGGLDSAVVDFLSSIDPGHKIPDKNNYDESRSQQYKAPDHFIFGRILIERKTLNGDGRVALGRINRVAELQGERFVVYGRQNPYKILEGLNDVTSAHQKYNQLLTNKFEQCVVAARDKFREHSAATGISDVSCILVVTEDGDEAFKTDGKLMEYHAGQLYLRRSPTRDKVGTIDAIFYIRDPAHTLCSEGGHWFKWVTDDAVDQKKRVEITNFGTLLFAALSQHFEKCGRDIKGFANPRQLYA